MQAPPTRDRRCGLLLATAGAGARKPRGTGASSLQGGQPCTRVAECRRWGVGAHSSFIHDFSGLVLDLHALGEPELIDG